MNDSRRGSAGSRSWRGAAAVSCLLLMAILFAGMAEGRNAISYNDEGWDFLKKGNSFKAIFSFKNALNKNPRYKEALIGLGKAYYEVQAYEQAFDLFERALKLDAKSHEALTGMGFTLIALGDYTGAMKRFDGAVKASDEDMEAHYGIAYLYSSMGKRLWAKRKLQSILKVNPYHVDSLLLMAGIKIEEKRPGEAKELAEKAIEANAESPRGYAKYGEILLSDYILFENEDSLAESVNSLQSALSIEPRHYDANRFMGYISLVKGNYDEAVNFYKETVADIPNPVSYYNLAVSCDLAGKKDEALEYFQKAQKLTLQDSILKSRVEDFLVFNDYKFGHPSRVALDRDNYDKALSKAKKNLHDQVVMYLRRALLMNPLDREAREMLMEYYQVNDYDELYINELKELQENFKDGQYRNKLTVAILKRRERLYHREGYSEEPAERDVPSVLVLNLDPETAVSPHPDAGEVIASSLTFAMEQFGRMLPVGIRERLKVGCGFKCSGDHLYGSIDRVQELVKAGDLKKVDYIVYGSYREGGNGITLDLKLLDNSKGFIIGEFSLSEKGKESLPTLSLRSARMLYAMIPYTGRVLKIKEEGIVVNLGLFDGVTEGQRLVVYKFGDIFTKKRKLVFTVKEADTYVCYAETPKAADLEILDSGDIVYPLNKRRAKKIK